MPRNNGKHKHKAIHRNLKAAGSQSTDLPTLPMSQTDSSTLEQQLADCQETARIHEEKSISAAQEAKAAQGTTVSDMLKRLDELKIFGYLEDLRKRYPDMRTDGNTASLSALETALLQFATDLTRKADPTSRGKAKPIVESDVIELMRDQAVASSERYDWGLISPFSDDRPVVRFKVIGRGWFIGERILTKARITAMPADASEPIEL